MKNLKYSENLVHCRISLIIVFFSFFPVTGNSQQWEPVPMVSQKIKDAGHFGGEGLQWPQALETDKQDGSFILYGTDVGGIFRSTNGGKMFEPANTGYNARGNSDFAIDPGNNTRAVAVGANSGANPQHGLYLTTDQGASWTHVLPFGDYNGYRDIRDQVQYDPTSYDNELGYCTDIYWSKINMNGGGGLFKSTDGGYTWKKVSDEYGSCIVKIHPTKGHIYLANGDLYRSTDGGAGFEMIEEGVTDIDVIGKLPDNIYALKAGSLYVSTDRGDSFARVSSTYFPDSNPNHLCVNPMHPDTMVMANFEPNYNYTRHYTHDGGKTWHESDTDNSLAWGAYNKRPSFFAWSPVDPATVWSVGGAWVTRSTDGGKVFRWYANGLNIVMTGGIFTINPNHTDNIFIGFQDQNAAFSNNAGYTWKYCNVSGKSWGGHCYSGFAANENILITGLADSWNAARELRISFDGGNTWTEKGVVNEGIDIAYGDPVDENILFYGNYRSADQGQSWFPMENCDGVCTSNPGGRRELYGVNGNSAVVSFDKGLTWETIASFGRKAFDIAFDHHRGKVYVALREGGFWVVNKNGEKKDLTTAIPRDQYNSSFEPRSVAVDPVKPEVVYAGQARGPYKTDVSVVRSVDGGENWQVINRNKRLNNTEFGIPGGQTAQSLRVHPGNRYLYVGTGCYGTWKIGPPDSTTTGLSKVPIDNNNLTNDESMIIFPNPVGHDNLTVKTTLKKPPYQVCVVAVSGKEVFSAEIADDYFELPAETFNPGMFIIRVYNEDNMQTGRIVKY